MRWRSTAWRTPSSERSAVNLGLCTPMMTRLPRERVLEPAQRLERLQAAHGGISPEVENDEPAAQLRKRQWAIDVQPCDAGRVEVRRADRRGAAHGVCRCLFTPRASRACTTGARFQSAAA